MKKMLLCGFLILSIFLISGCGKKEPINLNSENIEDYFIINKKTEGFSVDESRNSFIGGYLYTGYATLNITIKPKKDMTIDNVVIKGQVTLNGLCWTNNTVDFEIELDKDGYGDFSESIKTTQGILRPDAPSILEFEITEISGTIQQ